MSQEKFLVMYISSLRKKKDYQFTRKVKIKESEDEEEIPTMVIDED